MGQSLIAGPCFWCVFVYDWVQRIGPKGTDAVLERTVVYDYSENIPLFLKTFVGNGERFVLPRDTLDP